MLANTDYSAIIQKENIPIIHSAKEFASKFVFPDNTTRNYNDQIKHVDGLTNLDFIFYCDPQTSGGLLFSVNKENEEEMDLFLQTNHQYYAKVGNVVEKKEKSILFI
jgi:selenide,water dikinase